MIYFVETNKSNLAPKDLAEFGIAHLLDTKEPLASVAVSGKTPTGKGGVLVCNQKRFGTDGLKLDHDWQPLHGVDSRVRVAWSKRPEPDQLKRAKPLLGYTTLDADGREWQLPIVRQIVDCAPVSATPRYLQFDAEGALKPGDPKAEYVYLWDAGEEPWRALEATYGYERELTAAIEAGGDLSELGPAPDISDGDVLRWLSPIVAANYVVSASELVLMNTFDGVVQPLHWVVKSLAFGEWMIRVEEREEQKKTDAGTSPAESPGSTTTAGEAA